MPGIGSILENWRTRHASEPATGPRQVTAAEATALRQKVLADGAVSPEERAQLAALLSTANVFEAGAAETLRPLIADRSATTPGVAPPAARGVGSSGAATPLDTSGAHREVFLSAGGTLSLTPDGAPPASLADTGEAMFRAAEVVDDSTQRSFASLSTSQRQALFAQLKAALAQVPAGGTRPAGLDDAQAHQLRASASTVLLELMNSTTDATQLGEMVKAFDALVRAEDSARLRQTMIFHFTNSPSGKTPTAQAVAQSLAAALAPVSPPYEKWFANGNDTVTLAWTVGRGQFRQGFVDSLKQHGFTAVGAEPAFGVATYEATIDKGHGPTKFRISVREGGPDMLKPLADPAVNVVGYEGHSDWGRNASASVRGAGPLPDGGDGKLFFCNLCVGKSNLDMTQEKFPQLQVITTYGASRFFTDEHDNMTTSEGIQGLFALCDGIAARAPWAQLDPQLNRAANMERRTWSNFITPIATAVREKVLDADNDGQADYLDKLFNYSTFQVPQDTAREFQPVKQARAADALDGTKVLMAGNMVNTVSEFSGILERVNVDSKVIPGGWFDPKMGERDPIRFSKVTDREGKPAYVMQVSSRYAHMSEEALRAMGLYDFNRFLVDSKELTLDPVDAKLNGLLLFAHSLSVDEGSRDAEIWKAFAARYNFPPEFDLGTARTLLSGHEGNWYGGSTALVAKYRAQLSPAQLAALQKPDVGVPLSMVG